MSFLKAPWLTILILLQGSPNGSPDSLFLTAWKDPRPQRKFGFSSRLSLSNKSK